MKFVDIEWGSSEAKGDGNLKDYFYEFPGFDMIMKGNYRYIIGRKGTGKTAVIEVVKNKVDKDPLAFYAEMSLKDFPITILKELRDKGFEGKAQYVPVWEFLILSQICRTIIYEDNGTSSIESVDDLRRFYEDNDIENLSATQTLTVMKERNSKFQISALLKYLQATVGFDKKKSMTMVMDIHYQKISLAIKELIKTINTQSVYHVFLDELDEEFKSGDKSNKTLILSLLRAVENLNTYFTDNTSVSFRPLVALRSDIYNTLQDDNDTNKLHDFIFKLDWSIDIEDTKDTDMSIINIINRRINFSDEGKNCSWPDIVRDDAPDYIKGGIWSYITSRTFTRPRDVIKYLKICQDKNPIHDLSFKNVESSESTYSEWFYNEIRNEIYTHLPVWDECLNVFRDVGYFRTTKDEFIRRIQTRPRVNKYLQDSGKTADDLIEQLFNFSLIGNIDDKGRWSFKYKDDDALWNNEADLILHFGISKKFRLPTYRR
ncbi:hypothetical protein MMK76_002974 [Klebsiella aerogenes]|uniref:P-loop ATPase, Sll1717 family n=1 Tax=Klebsiella aerogenes TaxID=548 RepID=UPI0027FD6264|nr:hypothetical protein [Klebsiella aerogenes]EIY5048524.1 hypothetical protein [Klebsiella quasipneumoniae]EKU2766334.1 hypothetical protein [Klebsiella aerogenes]ELA0146268.1 hypothetical protein [Klebsiella aerogenes]ELS6160831.1 hypothetical protein [Klebsiella aerogenes]